MANNGNSAAMPKTPAAAELRAELAKKESDLGINGRLTGTQRIAAIFDEGTFVETGKYAKSSKNEFSDGGEFEGVITGYGAIDGRLVFAFVQDFSRMKGALGEMHAKKICALYDLALKSNAPVIGVFDSAGAFVLEGVSAMSGYGKIMKKVAASSGIIPQIAVVAGVCSGALATIAAMFDFTVASKQNGSIFVNPPFIMKSKKGGAGLGSIEAAYKLGLADHVCENEVEAYAKAKELLNYLPQNCGDGTVYSVSNDEINRLNTDISDIIAKDGYDMKEVITAVCDDAKFFERMAGYAPEILTGFITLHSMGIGIVANEPSVNGGKLTANAAKKAAKHIAFCDDFDIPLLTLVDTEGYETDAANESAPYSDALADLAYGYSASDNAKVSVVIGKAYGAAYTLMCSKSLGADIALAVDNAKISAMPTESAVAFAWSDKVKDNSKRAELENEWNISVASPVNAARDGDIDDIVSCDELRQRISAAFEMLSDR